VLPYSFHCPHFTQKKKGKRVCACPDIFERHRNCDTHINLLVDAGASRSGSETFQKRIWDSFIVIPWRSRILEPRRPIQVLLARPDFPSCRATSFFRSISIKFERVRFSFLASTSNLAFNSRSIFREMVVSFITQGGYYTVRPLIIKEHQHLPFRLTTTYYKVILRRTTHIGGLVDKENTTCSRKESTRSSGRDRLRHSNSKLARSTWGLLSSAARRGLEKLTESHGLSVAAGDLQLLDGRWYVTHSGLLRIAQRRHCSGISTDLLKDFSDSSLSHWVFKATVYKTRRSRGFVGYGDADPSNVSSRVQGAEMRVAETRAIDRALRVAYGIGLCSVEELGAFSNSAKPPSGPSHANGSHGSNGTSSGQPRLRDQLCLLIRQHNLNANLVKAYAADFCGTEALNGASRELVESFISHLATAAKENRDALVCKLNSYSPPLEARP
jgi:hypothetical protein